MDSCCGVAPAADRAGRRSSCPACKTSAASVGIETVKSLLTPAALARLEPGPFRFCSRPDCDVVYVSSLGQLFRTDDVRVPVWQKQAAGDRVLCYCFGENEADIRREIALHGRSSAVDRIRRHIAAGRCACELRNPRGACCLGDVSTAVKRLSASEEPAR